MPFFSVVIPTYNQASYLKKAIDSVLSQRYQNFEIIIILTMTFQSSSELHADFYKKAVEIGSLSKVISDYLRTDLCVLKPMDAKTLIFIFQAISFANRIL